MRGIVFGAQHRSEALAGACMDGAQECALLIAAVPPVLHRDAAAIGQHEPGNVDGIGMRMLRELERAGDVAAGIAAHGLDLDERAAQHLLGGAGNAILRPSGKALRQFAAHRADIADRQLAAPATGFHQADCGEAHAAELRAARAEGLIGHRREADLGLAELAEALARVGERRGGERGAHRLLASCGSGNGRPRQAAAFGQHRAARDQDRKRRDQRHALQFGRFDHGGETGVDATRRGPCTTVQARAFASVHLRTVAATQGQRATSGQGGTLMNASFHGVDPTQ